MKKVIFNKRKISWRDWIRVLTLLLIHVTGILVYLLLVLGFNFIYKQTFLPSNKQWVWLLFYPLIIGVILNVSLHIIYTEIGNSWVRLLMWIHTGLIAILISLIVFML